MKQRGQAPLSEDDRAGKSCGDNGNGLGRHGRKASSGTSRFYGDGKRAVIKRGI